MKPYSNIAGVILAAGESRRMGEGKPFLSWRGRAFVEIIAERLNEAGIKTLFIVFNLKDKDRIKPLELRGAKIIFNNKIELGQIYSLQLAIKIAQAKHSALMMCLVDHPKVTTRTYQALIEQHKKEPEKIIIPVYGDKRGHPVILPGWIFCEILAAGTEHGADYIINRYADRISLVPIDDEGVTININTKEKYQKYILEAK